MTPGPSVTFHVVDRHGKYASGRTIKFVDIVGNEGAATFGRDIRCDFVMRAANPDNEHSDLSVSRIAGEFVANEGAGGVEVWNYSSTNWIIVTGERGYSLNLAPRSRGLITQQDTVAWIEGREADYGFYITVPGADSEEFKRRYEQLADNLGIQEMVRQQTILATSAEHLKGSFAPAHQVILESMFADYISPRPGVFPRPRSVREVRDEVANSPVCKASYKDGVTDDHITRVLKGAIESARRHYVPGLDAAADSARRRPVDQAEWIRHRLALFLLGAGVISRSDDNDPH